MSAPQIDYATARHVVVAMGVRLELTPPGVKGRPTVSEILSPSDAKRLAWGILADLDPIEVRAVQYAEFDPEVQQWQTMLAERRQQRIELQRRRAAKPRQHKARGVGKIGPDTQAGRLLAALRAGERQSWEIEAISGVPTGVIGSRMAWLRQRGLVVRTDGRGAGVPATYALTEAGWAMLEARS